MNKKVIITIAVLLALIAVWYFFFRKKEEPVVIETEKPSYGHIFTSVTATGTVQPVDTVAVGTQVSGTLKYIYADFNDKVKKGELLAELDKILLQAEVDRNKGLLANSISQQVYQEAQYKREDQLYKVGAVSKADYDNQLYLYNAAKASSESARASLASAQRNLSFAEIYSPIDGVVLSRSVSVGQTVAASFSTPTLFVLAKDITKMQVQASVDEADIGNVGDSQRVSFTVDAYLEDEFAGRVQEVRLRPAVSANVVTYTTIISASNDNMKLKPGMTATVTIYTKEKDNALLIPAKALMFKPDSALSKKFVVVAIAPAAVEKHKSATPITGGNRDSIRVKSKDHAKAATYIWVLQGDTLLQKKVMIGLNDNTHAEVLSGLSENESVITGMKRETKKEAAAASSGGSPFMPQRRRR
ncbi:HlyD family secretion protein [Chitinophaga sp. CF118]|uniref:efflux RND transporter periplasmic adaptor subunit n=1 Tax=Chitinophaga sp. CF118 TaxID=1884367 RepID=UPI0008EB4CED|nr:efflux RND transporter periplasmic adaptor subunit [Chitinophaga sp. CF118]SFD78572.1 HlyD family secretion protein [Chitinophaga sp. CF118]